MNPREACYTRGDNFLARDIAGEIIIVPIRNGVGDLNAVYTLNEVGTRIWQLIDSRTSSREIAGTITAEYEVPETEALGDILEYLASLQEAGLIRPGYQPGSKGGATNAA
jgi:hypothetical protein